MKLLLLLLVALPVYADAPGTPPILISGEERDAIIASMGRMASHIEKVEKELKTCQLIGKT